MASEPVQSAHPRPGPIVPLLQDERDPKGFRALFGALLSRSLSVDTALLRIRLGSVDLGLEELKSLRRFRVLVAEVNARTVEEEAYGLQVDPDKRGNLDRVRDLLHKGIMEIRAAPLGGWSPDFSVFSAEGGPHSLLLGLHWFRRPFPHRGPAWATCFGAEEAGRGRLRFDELWNGAHDIGGAIETIMDRVAHREEGTDPPGGSYSIDTPLPLG